jgi:HSP20 family protein
MDELILWKNREIKRFREDIDRLFRQYRRSFGVPRAFLEAAEAFSMDISETENTLTVKAELPGIKPGDIQIIVNEDTLTIKGETKEDKAERGEDYQRLEKRSRSFSRTLKLPCRIHTDQVKATYKDNILQIDLPKCKQQEMRRVSIEIK